MYLAALRGPLGASWSKLPKTLPPTGRNPQEELASPGSRLAGTSHGPLADDRHASLYTYVYYMIRLLLALEHCLGNKSSNRRHDSVVNTFGGPARR
jgi:hypothetical protein